MFNLPKSTEFNRRIPKGKFYENLDVPAKVKRLFIEQVEGVYWSNKISEDTINIKRGEQVEEIQVFMIRLNQKSIDESILIQIDRQIPYHILYVLQYDDEYRACISYKESNQKGKNLFKVASYYYTNWMSREKLGFDLKGLSLDTVYEGLLRNIAGSRLRGRESDSLSESVKSDLKRYEVEQQISKLITQRNKEIQLNKQMRLNDRIRQLEKKLAEINL